MALDLSSASSRGFAERVRRDGCVLCSGCCMMCVCVCVCVCVLCEAVVLPTLLVSLAAYPHGAGARLARTSR
mgnify:CR=1 FL=1